MRSTIFSGFALMTSLLAGGAFAAPLNRRDADFVIDDVLVNVAVEVYQNADGSLSTGVPYAVGTTTIHGTPTVISTEVPTSTPASSTSESSTTSSTPVPTSSAEPISAAAFVAEVASSSSVAPVVVSTPEPTTAVAEPIVAAIASVIPTTLATSTSDASVATPTTASSLKKLGLAYNTASDLELLGGSSVASWCYSWVSSTGGTVPSGLEFVPMLHDLSSMFTSVWSTEANAAINSGSTHLLGFNEPDNSGTGATNIDVATALAGWGQYMQPFAGTNIKLGAPAVSSGDTGLVWLTSFLTSAKKSGYQINFVPIHWYGSTPSDTDGDFGRFKIYVELVSSKVSAILGDDVPLWVTEFGYDNRSGATASQNADFISKAIPYLNGNSKIERQSYFWVDEIMVTDGAINTIGEAYLKEADAVSS